MEANDNKPKTSQDYYREAREHFDKGDMDGVLANLNEALRIKPDFATALNNRGIVWKNKREYEKALADLEEAIRLKPDFTYALNSRGIIKLKKGEYDKAIMDFDRILRIDPNNHMAIQNMAIAIKRKNAQKGRG